jgi:glycosyltransferase involved in cell wall biosynthesis
VRLAWFTPWPPQPSGIAGRSVDATTGLARRGHAIDVFVDRRRVPTAVRAGDDAPAPGEVRIQSAHEFAWRHQRRQYDLIVYQIGNSVAHGFIWPYQQRYPGVVLLHDTHLHHARGAALLVGADGEAYREVFTFDHPGDSIDAAELAVLGFHGSYYFLWPMLRSVVAAARAVGVHPRGSVEPLRAAFPDVPIGPVALGMGCEVLPCDEDRREMRRGLGIPADALLFGVFGGLTAEKRVPQVLRAIARLRQAVAGVRLLLAGAPDPALELPQLIRALRLDDAVTLAPDLDDDLFERAIAAVDVSLNLRWPTAGETSGPWLQALAAGRATVTIDHPQHAHVPALDPQTWLPRPGQPGAEPVTVAIDIIDEEHSLELAVFRLAADRSLRERLGAAARRYWEREHTVARMIDDCERLFDRARAEPDGVRHELPRHLRPDPFARAERLLQPFGISTCGLF